MTGYPGWCKEKQKNPAPLRKAAKNTTNKKNTAPQTTATSTKRPETEEYASTDNSRNTSRMKKNQQFKYSRVQ